MSILGSLQVYAGNWELAGSNKFDEADLAAIDHAEVVTSTYGQSVCFFLKSGGQSYIPCSRNGKQLTVGQAVSPADCTIERLTKKGESDIFRCRVD